MIWHTPLTHTSQVSTQKLYTVMIENIPSEYRPNVAFRTLFDHLFPGQVFSTEVMQQLKPLAILVNRAKDLVEKVEDAELSALNSGVVSWGR